MLVLVSVLGSGLLISQPKGLCVQLGLGAGGLSVSRAAGRRLGMGAEASGTPERLGSLWSLSRGCSQNTFAWAEPVMVAGMGQW